MKRAIILFCEGPHDTAFIYRILKTIGYCNYDNILADYPKPLNSFFCKSAEKIQMGQTKFSNSRLFLPSFIMSKDEVLILLYSIGGDSKSALRKELLGQYMSFMPTKDPNKLSVETDIDSYAFAYLFDADDKGVGYRLEKISSEIGGVLNTSLNIEENGVVKEVEGIKCGSYIFTEQGKSTGKLEDILLPLLKDSNEEIFDDASHFLTTHHNPNRLKRLRIKPDADDPNKYCENRTLKAEKFDKTKSVIGIVGQLQNSGAANTVCIRHSDYLTLDKIENNKACQKIIRFIQNLT